MTGIERLKGMIEGAFQKPLFKIYMYLKTRPDMDEKYLNPEKSMNQMYEYIRSQVEKQSLVTVEVKNNKVVQSRVKYNHSPAETQQIFLKNWQENVLEKNRV